MKIPGIALLVVLIALLLVVPNVFFTVDETQLAIVTRFGQFKESHKTPGLKVKTPFVDSVIKFDRRLLRLDAPPASLLTKDKRNLVIDAYVRYRIVDPILFFRLLRNENQANSRVSDIVASSLRREVALDDQEEIISDNREEIMTRISKASNRQEISRADALKLEDGLRNSDLMFFIDELEEGETSVMRQRDVSDSERLGIIDNPQPPELGGAEITYAIPIRLVLGIDIVDVRIKRADFPSEIEESVFQRMRAERFRIASGLRADGSRREAEIRADVDKKVQVITESADGKASELRGEGEGEAIRILAEALNLDPEFYSFRRSLEAYSKAFANDTTLVLKSDSDFLRFLESSSGVQPSNGTR